MSLADEFDSIPAAPKQAAEPKSAASEFESIDTTQPEEKPREIPRFVPTPEFLAEQKATQAPEPSLADKIRAGIEATGGAAASTVASIPGIPYGLFNAVKNKLAGQPANAEDEIIKATQALTPNILLPKTELGQKYMENIGTAMAGMPVMAGEGQMIGASAQMAQQFGKIRQGFEAAQRLVRSEKPPVLTPLTVEAQSHNVNPILHQMISEAEQKGTINPVVARRHIEADALPTVMDENGQPIKVQLSEGEATQDPEILSHEKNTRSANPDLMTQMNNNGKALPLILDKFKEQVAPDIQFRNTPEEGQFYIDKLNDVNNQLTEETRQAYQALHDAAEQNGLTNTPLDAKYFAQDVADRFKKMGLYHEDLPPSVRMRVEKIASGEQPLDFKSFENLRTILGREQRKAASSQAEGSASASHAIGEVRDALENLPLTPEAQKLKPLADKARAAAKLNFDLQKQSPAYRAVAEGDARPDDFVQKYITGTNKNTGVNELGALVKMFPDDNQFHQALAYSALNGIKENSVNAKGALLSSKLDKSLSHLEDSGKSELLLPLHIRDGLDKLNKTAQLIQGAPPGNFIQTNPNLAAQIGHAIGSGTAQAVRNLVPFGNAMVNQFELMRARKAMASSTKLGAGLEYQPRKKQTTMPENE